MERPSRFGHKIICIKSLPKERFGLVLPADGRNIGRNVKFLTISFLHVSPRGAAACSRGKSFFDERSRLFFCDDSIAICLEPGHHAGRAIIVVLAIFSVFAWYMMVSKAIQMRRAKQLNLFFESEYNGQKKVLGIFDRRLQVDGCPMFAVYQEGCVELDTRLKDESGEARKKFITLKGMEHIKRTLEGAVARESIKLESGLILLASADSGGPFIGLLGTVWGVMDTFHGGDAGQGPDWQPWRRACRLP